MNIDQALDVAHTLARLYGVTHCANTECETCATRVLAQEVQRQRLVIQRLRDKTHCPHCGGLLVDGICAGCTG